MTSHFIFFFFIFSHHFPSRAFLWSEDHVYTESPLLEGTGRALLEEEARWWKSAAGSTRRLKVRQILHDCSVYYSGHMGRLHTHSARYMYIFGVCVCVYMSGPHGSGFHHCGPPASQNHVIRYVNAMITHHYPEVQVLVTPFSPESPPAAEADIPHLFTASGMEINTEGLNLKD